MTIQSYMFLITTFALNKFLNASEVTTIFFEVISKWLVPIFV